MVKMGNIHNIHIIWRFQTKKLFMIISHGCIDDISDGFLQRFIINKRTGFIPFNTGYRNVPL